MRAIVIVSPHPIGREALHMVQVFPVVLRQPFLAHGSVESFDIRILLRLARLDVIEPDVILSSPFDDRCAQVLGPVVAPNSFGPATPTDDLPQRTDHAFRWQ